MLSRKGLAVSVMLAWCLIGAAKDKKKGLLPVDVLQAQTVLVLVDPNAGVDIEHPNADRTAREDVEKALMKWGRFRLAVMDAPDADLVITVHKGNGKIAQQTIGGIPTNHRRVVMEPTDSGGRVGVRQGNPPYSGDPSSSESPNPQPQVEMGSSQDTFVVYRGNRGGQNSPIDSPAVWRYTAKDALDSPDVPAVDVFRKAIADTEKQLAGKP
jgi:hypothetical protein